METEYSLAAYLSLFVHAQIEKEITWETNEINQWYAVIWYAHI